VTRHLRIAIVSAQPVVVEELVDLCRAHPASPAVHACANLQELAALDPCPDLAVIVLEASGIAMSGEAAEGIMLRGTSVLVVLSPGLHELIPDLMRAGVSVFISTQVTQRGLHRGIEEVLAGPGVPAEASGSREGRPLRPRLSDQEMRAVVLYASGTKLRTVARLLQVQSTTAKEYIERVRAKYAALGRPAPTKIHLRILLQEDGFLESDPS